MITVDGLKIEAVAVDRDQIILLVGDAIAAKFTAAGAEAAAAVLVAASRRSREESKS